ncbi:hypothetical protein DIURU_000747 [Diutina rugosa]|uniref:Chitin synthase export chaperone n=1 Tax=Diutina rugosa TaxID=5481 RepID=A0A642V1P1_DIURU|nr:uncharacterized protein DIURU_000747 [Diutina rugosa]KAA8907063.1 hypothetical protein DIURU_000747 [Diutina rugosa]
MGFGNFTSICEKSSIPLCTVIGSVPGATVFDTGVIAHCYARPVELANTMIFQVGNAFVHFGGLLILIIILWNVNKKYTAIGRKEMLYFFYLAFALTVASLVVDCGVSPPSSGSYPYFVALQLGIASATCVSLLYNGIICFQFWEDGTRKSMMSLYIISFLWFALNFIIAIITFKSWGTSLNYDNTTGLMVVSFVLNAIIIAAYLVSQVILVFFALRNYWLLGAISLGVFFFVAGQVMVYGVSQQICNGAKHYIDGLFFGTLCNVFTIMMIYKYWDMITSDDLEFSVANVEQGINAFGMDDEKRASSIFLTH